MRNKKIGTWIATLMITMLTVLGLGQTMVHAVAEGPLTDVIITKVQTNDEAADMSLEQLAGGVDVEDYFTDGKVLPGVSFTYYSVSAEQLADLKAGTLTAADLTGGVTTAETGADGIVTIPNLPEGNYWVVENPKGTITSSRAVPFGLTLPFTNLTGDGFLRAINVYPKNTLTDDVPDIEKEVDEPNVAIGQLNTWKVSLDIPVGIEDYDKFSFYDIIDSRLDYQETEPVVVTATGITLVKDTHYTINYADPRLDVVFTEAGRILLADAESDKVSISFKTRVNDTAIMGQEIPNDATLEFNNGHGTDKEKPVEEPPSVHTGGRAFLKKDEKTGATIDGAEFKIKNLDGKFVNVGANGAITFGGSGTTFTSANGGKFEVRGLPYGSYDLVETKAPQGYALRTSPIRFEVDANSYYVDPTIIEDHEALPTPEKVITINNRGLVIPQTGGIGTVLFTVIGAVMMLFSVLFYKRTKEA